MIIFAEHAGNDSDVNGHGGLSTHVASGLLREVAKLDDTRETPGRLGIITEILATPKALREVVGTSDSDRDIGGLPRKQRELGDDFVIVEAEQLISA